MVPLSLRSIPRKKKGGSVREREWEIEGKERTGNSKKGSGKVNLLKP